MTKVEYFYFLRVVGGRNVISALCMATQAMHERHATSLRRVLDNEEWKQADVPAEIQRMPAYSLIVAPTTTINYMENCRYFRQHFMQNDF